jgi:peptidoglycan/LPS O-acetylase OafA/YrhL
MDNMLLDRKENNFDFIRLMLAMLVIFSHSYPLGAGSETNEPLRRLTHGQTTAGGIAVDLFFVISGFLITASFVRSPSLRKYFQKRVCRIYPGFIAVMLLSAVVLLPAIGARVSGGSLASQLANFSGHTATLAEFKYQNAFTTNPFPMAMNGSTWSISYEFWCYIGIALLGFAGFLRHRAVVLGLFLASVVVSCLAPNSSINFETSHIVHIVFRIAFLVFGVPANWARLGPLYLAGTVIYLYRSYFKIRWTWATVSLLLLLAACWVPWGWAAVFPVAGSYLTLFVAYYPALRLHNWARYGDFSYGTYLYAFPVMQVLMRWIGHPVRPVLLFLPASVATLCLAVLSWHGVEKWFLPRARWRSKVRNEKGPLTSQAAASPTRSV